MRSRSVWLKKDTIQLGISQKFLLWMFVSCLRSTTFRFARRAPENALGKPTFRELRCFGFGKSLVTGLKHGEHGMEAYK